MRKLTTLELIEKKGDFESLKNKPRAEVYLILDNIRSMYNVGAIFRTADAARIKKLYLCGITAKPPRREIEKTALKTIENVPWEYKESTIDLVKELKSNSVNIYTLEQTDQSFNYHTFSYKYPCAIIIGHETEGVNQEVLKLSEAAVEIPMRGIANSLNVATAAGIILFKMTESRLSD